MSLYVASFFLTCGALYKNAGQVGEPSSSNNLVSYRSSFQSLSNEILPGTTNIRTLLGFELESASVPKLRFLRVLNIERFLYSDQWLHSPKIS